jgi:hypothetical protein
MKLAENLSFSFPSFSFLVAETTIKARSGRVYIIEKSEAFSCKALLLRESLKSPEEPDSTQKYSAAVPLVCCFMACELLGGGGSNPQ